MSNFFQGGGGGPNANFFRNPYTYFFPGGIWGGGDLSGLMTDEVFQMMHWYCVRLTPSRNTAL